jgi:hypothetical protein
LNYKRDLGDQAAVNIEGAASSLEATHQAVFPY